MTSRREFLRLAAGGVAAATLGGACGSDSSGKTTKAEGKNAADTGKRRTLRIAQWNHLHPGYDVWFDGEYVKRWGDEHDVDVVVDHLPYGQLLTRADIEVRERRGHDLFAFPIGLPIRFEDSVIDHGDIVEEARRRVGPMAPHVERSVRNAKTGRFFGVSDWWGAVPTIYRSDLWSKTGVTPATWDDVRRAGPALKAAGHPIGIGMAPEGDAQITLSSLMFCYGGSIQDEEGTVTIGRPATVEAVKVGVEIYRKGMTPEVLDWKDPVSDNRALLSGQASLIVDPISSVRAAETQNPALAPKLSIARAPAGPAGAFGGPVHHSYFVWQFAEQRELAEQFLVDLVTDYREPFLRSGFYNLPAFPGGVPDLGGVLAADAAADPKGKYSVLANAAEWSTNAGHPGHDNAAIEEVVNQYIVPKMFAAAARGDMSAEAAVRNAETQVKQIFDKWRGQGKI
jgi:multiple sugar transport system substrate-binding protein